jgi:rhodanese-related sulfurtransferase
VDYDTLSAFIGRHPLLGMGLVGLTIAILINELSPLFRGYKALRPAQLTALINRESALVVDLRAYNDYEKGHIAGAKNVPPNQFDPDAKPLAGAKESPVVIVCQSGVTAGGAARKLKRAGFAKVSILDGGIAAWQSADLPLVKGRN